MNSLSESIANRMRTPPSRGRGTHGALAFSSPPLEGSMELPTVSLVLAASWECVDVIDGARGFQPSICLSDILLISRELVPLWNAGIRKRRRRGAFGRMRLAKTDNEPLSS